MEGGREGGVGHATAICSDKTGTLTENRVAVTKCYLGGREGGREGGVSSRNCALLD